jgi:tetratricopeptide (TPR) repeat protein
MKAPNMTDEKSRDADHIDYRGSTFNAPVTGKGDINIYGLQDDDVPRRELLRKAVAGVSLTLSTPLIRAIQGVRRDMDKTLAASTTSASMLDQWEESADEYGFAFRYRPPTQLLCDIALAISEVQHLCSYRQPLSTQKRLYHIAARLAGIGALALNDIGHFDESRYWFQTARTAAEETADRHLRAWVLAKQATEFLFQGRDAAFVIQLARRAQEAAGTVPSPGLVIALSAEARGHAVLGQPKETMAAFALAEDTSDKLPAREKSSSVYAYSEHQLLYHEGDALTAAGDWRSARDANRRAAALYPSTEPLEPILIRINEAKCHALEGDIDEACRHGLQALHSLPKEYHDTVAVERARGLLSLIPARSRVLSSVRELEEALRAEQR